MDQAIQTMQKMDLKGAKITLVGHTDTRGSMAYNVSLSEQRAKNVQTILEDQLKCNSTTNWKSFTQLATTETTEPAHALNRRVVVIINK
jgi:outer membrane protein OmpA-like peptidoglycan-associated protein